MYVFVKAVHFVERSFQERKKEREREREDPSHAIGSAGIEANENLLRGLTRRATAAAKEAAAVIVALISLQITRRSRPGPICPDCALVRAPLYALN